jgi:hypothetical protein
VVAANVREDASLRFDDWPFNTRWTARCESADGLASGEPTLTVAELPPPAHVLSPDEHE